MSYSTGLQSTALLNGTELPVSGWTVDAAAEIIRFSNSKTGGKRAKAPTYSGATGTIDFDFDAALHPFSSPLNVVPGTILSTVKMLIDGSSGTLFWSLSSIIITRITQAFNHEGKPVNRLMWEDNAGVITPPSGTAF